MSSPAASPAISFAALRETYNKQFEVLKSSVAAVSTAELPDARKAALNNCFDVLVRPHFCP